MLVPGTSVDRAALTLALMGQANPPFFISGEGSTTRPWRVRMFRAKNTPDPAKAPCVVSLNDDPEGVFQSNPPSPVDLAVVLNNCQRLGVKRMALAAVLAWDSPDPIGLAALDQVLARFDALVMAAPLTRGAVAEAMPQAFREASLPLRQIHGDVGALPVGNRVSMPGVILGRVHTLAGFQVLDTQPMDGHAPLLARWDDRLVLAFPLLAAMQRLDLPVDGLEIRLGESLRLGPKGPMVPIDRFGRLAMPRSDIMPRACIPAAILIDGQPGLLSPDPLEPVVLRDDHSASEPATRRFSERLPTVMASIASDGLAPALVVARPGGCRELVLLALWIVALTLVSRLSPFPRRIAWLGMAGFVVTSQGLAASAGYWLPGLPAAAALAAAMAACLGYPASWRKH
jgi:hypothetical protein